MAAGLEGLGRQLQHETFREAGRHQIAIATNVKAGTLIDVDKVLHHSNGGGLAALVTRAPNRRCTPH